MHGKIPQVQVLDPFRSFFLETGLHVGHLIGRQSHVQLAQKLVEHHYTDWVKLMNVPTLLMKAPKRWSPLMSCMDATRSPTSRMPDDERQNLRCMITHMVDASSADTLMNTAVNGGTFVHMARDAWLLEVALDAVTRRKGNRDDYGEELAATICNIAGKNGHGAIDVHWNNGPLKRIVLRFGGYSIKPMPGAYGKGRHGKAGKGSKDGVTPDHYWNRQYGNASS